MAEPASMKSAEFVDLESEIRASFAEHFARDYRAFAGDDLLIERRAEQIIQARILAREEGGGPH